MEFDSVEYWKKRYATGGNSGSGSYGGLAEYKASSLNRFIADHDVESIVEFGSGDGNQLGLINIPKYLGLDVSPDAIANTSKMYEDDQSKSFLLYDPDNFESTSEVTSQLAISMDVILHLTEDERFDRYMKNLFASATRFVGIFNTATDTQLATMAKHNRFRDHRTWISTNRPEAKEVRVDMLPEHYGYPAETGFFFYAI